MPISYFLDISKILFDPLLDKQEFCSQQFEIFLTNIDIFYRVFEYYDNILFSPEKKENQRKIKYSDLFKGCQIFGKSDLEFQVQSKYEINDNYY